MPRNKQRLIAVGLGEILWDMLPGGKQLGGAPFNFARHCDQLGLEGFPVSQIGTDELGDETLALLEAWGVTTGYVSRIPHYKTGVVRIRLDDQGKPTYDIRDNAAWDHMLFDTHLEELAPSVNLASFGTLAQRSESTRHAIYSFLDRMRSDSLRLFDINIRQQYYSTESIERSLLRANILKLSDEELPIMRDAFSLNGSVENQLSELKSRFNLKVVAFTRGAEGSLLIDNSGLDDHAGVPADKIDTIGAGDSFAATLCVGILSGMPLAQINENANKVASYVCSQPGATPELPCDLISDLSTFSDIAPKN